MGESRPILFNGEMVRSIPDGRKTQTRRPAKLTDAGHVKEPRGHRRWHPDDPDAVQACPLGRVGDLLWVRETWARADLRFSMTTYVYRADGEDQPVEDERWRPSIHMPKEVARIWLRVTYVRLQRLQSISEEDARAEGVGGLAVNGDALGAFAMLWDGVYGEREGCDWASNPWVWAVTFERVRELPGGRT